MAEMREDYKVRNAFVSYSHRLDQVDADDFRYKFSNPDHLEQMVFSDRSLENMDLGSYSDQYIKDIFYKT